MRRREQVSAPIQASDAGNRRLTGLVSSVTVAGVLALLAAGEQLMRHGVQIRPVQVLVVIAVVLVGDISLLRIRFGANGNSFTWGEASLIVGAVVGGWPVLLVVGTLTILVRQLVIRRAVRKCLFNAGSFAVGVVLASAVFHAISPAVLPHSGSSVSARAVFGLAAAAATYFLWTSLVVIVAVSWSQHVPARQVWTKGSRLRALMLLGNTSAGLGAVLIGGLSRPTLLALPFFLLCVYYIYNNYLRAQEERDRWQDLQAATLELQQVDPAAVTDAVQRGAEALFGAECTALLFADDVAALTQSPAILGTWLSARQPVIIRAKDTSDAVRRELAALGVVEGVVAPLLGVGVRTGILIVGFHGPAYLKRREVQVVATFANHASVSMQRARLFGELDEQRSRLSAVIDNASDGVVLVGADGVVESWNPGMARLTGRPERNVLGHPLDDAFPGQCGDGTTFTLRGVLDRLDGVSSTDHLTLDVELETAEGTTRDASLSVSAVRSPSGACEYVVLVARDITAKREVAQAKQDFIATVSHELRTPLTPIKGFLSLFLRPDFHMEESKRRVILGQMLERANQLERLVEDLLSTSRMEHGEFSLRPQPTDVDLVVERAVDDLSLATGRSVTLEMTGTKTQARSDPARLQQVVANLLSNAEKYSPAPTPIIVRVGYRADVVEIAVQDFGAGIPEDQQAEVFEPFHRLGDHLTRKTRGCGLGLHIARQLVDGMGGRIWVESELGVGSTFHVSVPAISEQGIVAPHWTSPPVAPLRAVG